MLSSSSFAAYDSTPDGLANEAVRKCFQLTRYAHKHLNRPPSFLLEKECKFSQWGNFLRSFTPPPLPRFGAPLLSSSPPSRGGLVGVQLVSPGSKATGKKEGGNQGKQKGSMYVSMFLFQQGRRTRKKRGGRRRGKRMSENANAVHEGKGAKKRGGQPDFDQWTLFCRKEQDFSDFGRRFQPSRHVSRRVINFQLFTHPNNENDPHSLSLSPSPFYPLSL